MKSKARNQQKSKDIVVQYLILVRHGSREKGYDSERGQHRLEEANYKPKERHEYKVADRTKPGRSKSLSLAGWLAETLKIDGIKVSYVLYSSQKHAEETATAYLEALQPQKLCTDPIPQHSDPGLNPELFWNAKKQTDSQQPFENWIIKAKENKQALLICGHQPQLTWIANAWVRRSYTLPLRQSEAALIQLVPRAQTLWAISADNHESVLELKDKIKSKMDVAKFFAGFISLLLAISFSQFENLSINTSRDQFSLIYAGVFFVLLSLGLCVATLFAYDRLLMPSLFWSGNHTRAGARQPRWVVRRPPSAVHWVLYSNMVRAWKWLFVPAVLAFFIGLSAFLIAVLGLSLVTLGIVLLALLIPVFANIFLRPNLGFDD